MPQTSGRLFDDLSRLITDAAGLAEGARREVETIVRAQFERLLAGMDVVTREEFEAVERDGGQGAERKRSSGGADRGARSQARRRPAVIPGFCRDSSHAIDSPR